MMKVCKMQIRNVFLWIPPQAINILKNRYPWLGERSFFVRKGIVLETEGGVAPSTGVSGSDGQGQAPREGFMRPVQGATPPGLESEYQKWPLVLKGNKNLLYTDSGLFN